MALVIESLITIATAFASYCWPLIGNSDLLHHGADPAEACCYSCLRHCWHDFNDLYHVFFAGVFVFLQLYPLLEGLEATEEMVQALSQSVP